MKGRIALPVLAAAGVALGGCGGDQSPLSPDSRASREIATLWWWMLAVAAVVFAGAVALLLLAWVRRRRKGAPVVGERERFDLGMVVLFGMGVPAIALIALFIVGNFVVLPQTEAPAAAK